MFQEASLFPHLTVRGNLDYGLKRAPRRSARQRSSDAIELLGIGPLLERAPAQLSGGERQRVAIARALRASPRLLLMDEPLASLDAARKEEILPYLERLHDELAIPMLYVSHSPDEVARLADHLVLLDGGRVLAQGPLRGRWRAWICRCARRRRRRGARGQGVQRSTSSGTWRALDLPAAACGRATPGFPWPAVRVRVLARDVSLALKSQAHEHPELVAGSVDAIADDEHPGLALVRVRVGEAVVARSTKRAARTSWASVAASRCGCR